MTKPAGPVIVIGDSFAEDSPRARHMRARSIVSKKLEADELKLTELLVREAAELYGDASDAIFYSLTNGVPTMPTEPSKFLSSTELRQLDRQREYERRYRGTYSPIDEDRLTPSDHERLRAQADRITQLEINLRNANAECDRMQRTIARDARIVDWEEIRTQLEQRLRLHFGPSFDLRPTAMSTFMGACSSCKHEFVSRGDPKNGTIFLGDDVGRELGKAQEPGTFDAWFAANLAVAGDLARRDRAFELVTLAAVDGLFTFACGCVRDHLALRNERRA